MEIIVIIPVTAVTGLIIKGCWRIKNRGVLLSTPRRGRICPMITRIEIPLINPETTGCGKYFTKLLNPMDPRTTCMHPAVKTHKEASVKIVIVEASIMGFDVISATNVHRTRFAETIGPVI